MSKISTKFPPIDVFVKEIIDLDDSSFGSFLDRYSSVQESGYSEDAVYEFLKEKELLEEMVDSSPSTQIGRINISKSDSGYRVTMFHRDGIYSVDETYDLLDDAVKHKLHNIIGSIRASRGR